MGDPPVVLSASQIQTWIDCRRKWAWDRIAKIPREQHPSAALGTRTHKQLEHYLLEGRPLQFTNEAGEPDETGDIAAPALSYLPAPMTPGLEVERKFRFRSPRTGLVYNGLIDWRLPPDAEGVPGLWYNRDRNIPTVGDHKTTSGLRWAKTMEDLRTDVQAIVYAADTLVTWPDSPQVRLQWTYMQTKGSTRALPVVTELDKPWVEQAFSAVEDVGLEIATTLYRAKNYVDSEARAAFVRELTPNPHACRAFGGCPYQHVCNLSPREVMRASMSDPSTPSILDRLRNIPAPAADTAALASGQSYTKFHESWAQAASDVAAAKEEKPETAAAPPSPAGGSLLASLTETGRTQTAAPNVSVAPRSEPDTFNGAPPSAQPVRNGLGDPASPASLAEPVRVNPPEFQPAPTAEQRAATAASAPAEAPKKRTRRTKAEMEAARAAAPTAAQAHAAGVDYDTHAPPDARALIPPTNLPAPIVSPSHSVSVGTDGAVVLSKVAPPSVPNTFAPTPETTPEHLIDVLFINCVPLSGESYVPGAHLAAKANARVRAATGKADYRYLDFGQGPGALAGSALEELEEFDVPPSVAVDTMTPEGAVLANSLEARAKHVVRGLR